jgi:RING finger/CHY zinc finger protein 1
MTYKCPTCSSSIVDTTHINEFLDNEISLTPMPNDYKDMMVKILCNDCHKESDVKFHIIALKCQCCGGFNTRKI